MRSALLLDYNNGMLLDFRRFLSRSILTGSAGAVLLCSTGVPGFGQWFTIRDAAIPRTADGKANLTAPTPKAPDGKPDLSGIWEPDNLDRFFDLAVDPKQEVPFQPWARAVSERVQSNNHKDDPLKLCMPPGVPRAETIGPFKIIQTPKELIVLYETTSTSAFRQFFTDGRALPNNPQPTWMGYSVGTWEGDVLKVDSIGFNDRGWLDTEKGHPQTEALHVIERFRRMDFGHLEIGITIDDPKAYTRPWTSAIRVHLMPDTELLETICENSRGLEHMVGK
jgi:hypothetical protein